MIIYCSGLSHLPFVYRSSPLSYWPAQVPDFFCVCVVCVTPPLQSGVNLNVLPSEFFFFLTSAGKLGPLVRTSFIAQVIFLTCTYQS